MNYQLTNHDAIRCINGDGTDTWIPFSDQYPDYQQYLAWLAEGNTPLPAPAPEPAPVLSTEEKLEAAGLTVAELRELFGLPEPG